MCFLLGRNGPIRIELGNQWSDSDIKMSRIRQDIILLILNIILFLISIVNTDTVKLCHILMCACVIRVTMLKKPVRVTEEATDHQRQIYCFTLGSGHIWRQLYIKKIKQKGAKKRTINDRNIMIVYINAAGNKELKYFFLGSNYVLQVEI